MTEKSLEEIRSEYQNDLCLNLGYAHNAAWAPDLDQTFELANRYRKELSVPPSSQDTLDLERMQTHLLIVNPQKDFACSNGTMFNPDGEKRVNTTNNIVKFIYKNVEGITRITPTLTNHFPFQIMFESFWVGQDDKTPEKGTVITAKQVEDGLWKPNPGMALWMCQNEYDWLVEQVQHYCEKLEESGRTLTILPPHCMHGSVGYGIVGVIEEARMFHAIARSIQPECEVNGSNPLAENYSFLGPDIGDRKDEDGPVGWKNIPALASTIMVDNLVLSGHFRVADTARDILAASGPEQSNWPCRFFYLKGGVFDEEDMPEEFTAIESLADIPPPEEEEDEDDGE